ncbi:carboxypeptidase-like regulatory domain-containing protein [Aquimarina sp. W85]|uniref:carboxypeptidase-like regulatory domain-containing protein n=1 Tax=Aquimarina rhodophyticola TaxID=3342246 RepID=UPI00366EA6E0
MFLLLGNFLSAQSIVSGVVTDSIAQPIPSANVYLKRVSNQAIIAFAYTNTKGAYTIQTDAIDSLLISFSALGYATQEVPILLDKNSLQEHNAQLFTTSYALDEVVISAERAITEKKDTIVFNAASFKQGEESVVQDLLKKLPGVDVSDTGVIKVDGKEVEKVMVEGDDFFKKGYRLLTKNLDVNAVDKVEVLRRYSGNRLLQGIEESEKVAINLKLDEGFKRDWFGNLSPAYGVVSENRYDVDATLSSFGKKNKYFLIGSLNNIGVDASEDIQGLINPQSYTEEVGTVGEDQRVNSLISLDTEVPGLKKERTNFNDAELVSLNTIFKINSKVNIKLLGLFNGDDAQFNRNSEDTFVGNSISFTNLETYQQRKASTIGFGRAELIYDISNSKVLEYEGKYTISDENSNTNVIFNTVPNSENLSTTADFHDHNLKYSYRFKVNKVLLLTARYLNEKKPQSYTSDRFLFDELFPSAENVEGVLQYNKSNFWYSGFKALVIDRKKNKDVLHYSIGYNVREDDLQSDFILQETTGTFFEPDAYKNRTSYTTQDLYVHAEYRKKIEDFGVTLDLEGHQLYNELETVDKTQQETPAFLNSKLKIDWEINKTNKLFGFIQNSSSNATIGEVYPQYVQTGYQNFERGLGNFNQQQATQIFTGYTLGNFGDRFIANVSLAYTKHHNFLSTDAQITQNVIQSTKLRIPNREFYSANARLERYMKFIRNNIKIKLSYSKSEFKNRVNGLNRSIENQNYRYGFELRSGFRGIFNYHFGTTWNLQKIYSNNKNTRAQNTSFLDLYFVLNPKLNLQLQTERYYFNNIQNDKNAYYFADLELKYQPGNSNMSFMLIGKNLFNTNTYRSFTVTDTYISTTAYRVLPRYLMLKVNLKF